MSWKKNALSYGMWIIYLVAASLLFLSSGIFMGMRMGIQSRQAAAGIAAVLILAVALIFVGMRSLSRRIPGQWKMGEQTKLLVEALFAVVLFAVGLFIRISCLAYAGEEASYYDAALVAEGAGVPSIVHGAVYLYLQLLHGLFYVVGNKWMAGIWLQIVLQAIAVILWYLAVRRLSGPVPALVAEAFVMMNPDQVLEGITYSPRLLYLCIYGAGLLCIALFLDKRARGLMLNVYDVILLVFAGAWLALVCYMDITGVTLLLFAVSVLWIKKPPAVNLWGNALLEWVILTVGTIGSFLGYMALDAFASTKPFLSVLRAWYSLYLVKGYDVFFWYREGGDYIAAFVLAVLLFLGVLAFWCRKREELTSPWILTLACVCLLLFCHIPAETMENTGLAYYICAVLAGIGLSEAFYPKPAAEGIMADVKNMSAEVAHAQAVDEERGQTANHSPVINRDMNHIPPVDMASNEDEKSDEDLVILDEGQKAPKKVHYIENPLPLPKKHVKKVMDYGYEPEDTELQFDLKVSEEDDFDI